MTADRAALRIIREPELHVVPDVTFADGSTSSAWEDFHAVRREQRPDLYEGLGDAAHTSRQEECT